MDITTSRAPRVVHKKSCKGCAQCKRRHVKCDEASPCANCIRHAVPCSLAGGPWVPREDTTTKKKGTRSIKASSDESATRRSSSRSPFEEEEIISPCLAMQDYLTIPSPSPVPPATTTGEHHRTAHVPRCCTQMNWIIDLELMHYFMSHTKAILAESSDSPYIVHVWKQELPKLAFADAYKEVLHVILGLSALHREVMEGGGCFWRGVANGHLNYRRSDDVVSRYTGSGDIVVARALADANARYVVGWLNVVCCFAMEQTEVSGGSMGGGGPGPIDAILDIMEKVIVTEASSCELWYLLSQGPFAPIVTRGFQGASLSNCQVQPEGTEIRLSHLDYMLDVEVMLSEDHAVCGLAIAELRESYAAIVSEKASQLATVSLASILSWPKQDLTGAFRALLKRRVPQALVILSFHADLLDTLGLSRWWLKGFGARLLQEILLHLDSEWKQWVHWPVQDVSYSNGNASSYTHTDPEPNVARNVAISSGMQVGFEATLR